MNHDPTQPDASPPSFWRSRYAVGLVFFGALSTYLLLSEHRAHFLGVLPFLFLLSCPLMHVFMHHGHGGHSNGGGGDRRFPTPPASPARPTGDQP